MTTRCQHNARMVGFCANCRASWAREPALDGEFRVVLTEGRFEPGAIKLARYTDAESLKGAESQ